MLPSLLSGYFAVYVCSLVLNGTDPILKHSTLMSMYIIQQAFSMHYKYVHQNSVFKVINTFAVNDRYSITFRSVFVQANGVLDTLPPYINNELLDTVTIQISITFHGA